MTFALIMPELVPNTNQGWGDKVQVAITSFSLNPHIKKKSAAFDIFDDTVQIDSCISANLLGTRIFSNPWANVDAVHFCSVSAKVMSRRSKSTTELQSQLAAFLSRHYFHSHGGMKDSSELFRRAL